MPAIEESVQVNLPLRTVYDQWTQFEDYPSFMEGIESVEQVDDRRLHWVAQFGGKRHEWDAEITDQTPDRRVAWHDVEGKTNAGSVEFEEADGGTRVTVRMDWEPEGAVEKIGEKLGFDERRVKGDLERFKQFIESRGEETGAWRGDIGSQG